MRACLARGGYSGCTRCVKLPSIIRETRGGWPTGAGGRAKLGGEFAIELMIGFSLQRLLAPPGTPSRLTSTGGSGFSGVINFISREVGGRTMTAAVTGLLGCFVSRRISGAAAARGGDKIGSTIE